MNPASLDWSMLRAPLAWFLFCAAVGVALLSWSYYFSNGVNAEYQRKHSELRSVRSKYQGVDDEERVIETYMPRYYDLEARGIIGGERRLDWIESITDAAAVVRVPTFLYSFDAQRPYQASFPLDSGKFQIFATNVTLTLGLLHEGDLPALLNELDRSAAGQFSVSNCDMARTGEQVLADPRHNNVDAVCHLQWFTIKKPDDDEESRS